MRTRLVYSFLTIKLGLLVRAWLLMTSVGMGQPARVPTPSALKQLSYEFWEWRASEQPFSFDDIPRLDRPAGWAADWSSSTIAKRSAELSGFETRWKALGIPVSGRSPTQTVDYLPVASAIALAQ